MAALLQYSQWDMETSEILRGLRTRDPYDEYFAIVAIGEMARTDLLPRLLPLFQSRFLDLKLAAIRVIGQLGRCEPAFYTVALVPLLNSFNAGVRYETAVALGRLGHLGAFADLCRSASEDPDDAVRHRSARSAKLVSGEAAADDEKDAPRVAEFNPFRLAMTA